MIKPLVSAIITTHNRIELLKRAILSVKNQTYSNIEIIIVNDNSNDGTMEYLNELSVHDRSILHINISPEESHGGNYARNQGIKNASGEYIAFLDDDDYWMPQKIMKQVDFLKNHSDFEMVYCNMIFFNDREEWKNIINLENQGDCSKISLYRMICTSSTIMCTKNILERVGGFDENLRFWQDTDLVIRIAQCTNIGFVNEYLVKYYADEKSKQRLTNKYYEWWKAVEYHNKKHEKLISCLTKHEKKMRLLLIYRDAEARAKVINNSKEVRFALKKIAEIDPSAKNITKYIVSFLPDRGEKMIHIYRNIKKILHFQNKKKANK